MITLSFDPRVAVVALALLAVLFAAFVLVRLARTIRGSSERAEVTLRSRLEELEERVRSRIAHLSDKLGRPTGDPLSRLLVTDIKIGKNSQLASADSLPATLFAVASDPMRQLRLHFDTADISQQMRVDVTNVSNRDELVLNGVFVGTAVGGFDGTPQAEDARDEYAVGLPTTRLGPHGSTSLVARPQIPFRGKRLFLTASFAEGPAPRELIEAAPFYRGPPPAVQKRPWWRNLLPFHRDAAS